MSNDQKDGLLIACVILLFATSVFSVFAFLEGVRARHQHPRALISNQATFAQVEQNFTGRPYDTGHYMFGYSCKGYTRGKHGHGWVVIQCVK